MENDLQTDGQIAVRAAVLVTGGGGIHPALLGSLDYFCYPSVIIQIVVIHSFKTAFFRTYYIQNTFIL